MGLPPANGTGPTAVRRSTKETARGQGRGGANCSRAAPDPPHGYPPNSGTSIPAVYFTLPRSELVIWLPYCSPRRCLPIES